jgi:ABC-2 type transport system ATP-binding protein
VPQGQVDEAVARAAARVQLSDRIDQRAGELSRGLKQRLAIAQTIVHQPRALLLDEPAAGLDPEARRSLSDLILKLAGEGMTIVVSSHILAELEDYSTRMLMIREGRVAGGGIVAAQAHDETRVTIAFADPPGDLAARLEPLGAAIERRDGQALVVLLPPGEDAADFLTRLVQAGLRVRAYQPLVRTLEDAYMAEAPPEPAP